MILLAGVHVAAAEPVDVPTEINDTVNTTEMATPATHSAQGVEKVVIESQRDVTDDEIDRLKSLGAEVSLTYGSLVQAEIDNGNRDEYAEIPWVTKVRDPIKATPNVGGEGAEAIGAQTAHEAGVTGDNVSVAVIDLGFDVNNTRISQNVVGYKSFGVSDIAGSSPRHGTSSAEIVLDVAPDADLYLATVATDVGYANALDWAEKKEVDVITASLGFFGQPNDGTGLVSQVSDETVNATDAVFTASAGNSGESHWEGDFSDDDGDGRLDFESGEEVNYLNAGSGTLTSDAKIPAGVGVQIHLTWDDWDTADSNYNLALVRSDGNGDLTEVRSKETDARGGQPYKRLRFTTSTEAYYGVVVQKTAGDSDEVEIFSRTTADKYSSFLHKTTQGSIVSPAVAKKTLGIGAFNYDSDTIAPYSSRGPTNDGRQGVTIAAPDCATTSAYNGGQYCGTSGASPHVAGVAALLRSATEINTSVVKSRLVQTADSMPGDRYAVGAGAVNASAAVSTVIETGGDSNETGTHESGVSQELWMAVTGDGTLTLGDLGTAIQEYQDNGQVNGVNISLGDLGSLIQEYQT
jgi:subtilisin family serine protease